MSRWSAELIHDPDSGSEMYVRLLDGKEDIGKIFRNGRGHLVLAVSGRPKARFPLDWLLSVAKEAVEGLG